MDALSLTARAGSLAETIALICRDWSRMAPEEWAEEVYRLPGGGRFRWTFAPYSRRMFDSLFDAKTIETVFQLYSRGLKSTVILLAIGYVIDQMPRRILSLWPTNSQGEKWSKDNLCGELLNTTPCLNFLGNMTGRRIASNTLLHKAFPGGLIDIFGANAPGDMRRAKGSFLYADEIDAVAKEQTDEGDQLAIFSKRGDEYPDTIRVFASYPSIKELSRIQAKLDATNYNEWHSTCVRCGGEPFIMHRSLVKYDDDKPELARIECPRCHELLTDAERHQMAHGQGFDCWKPRHEFRGRRGFHGNALLWPHPTDPVKMPGGYLQMLAMDEIKARESEDPRRSMRVLVNTVDAEPFDPQGDDEQAPDWQPLFARREKYNDGEGKITVPKRCLVLNAGVDLQLNRIEVSWWGHGRRNESWSIAHEILPGNIYDDGVWADLEKELSRKFDHDLGGQMPLTMAFVDASKWPDAVWKFLERKPLPGKIRACRGTSQRPYPMVNSVFTKLATSTVRVPTGERSVSVWGHWIGGDACADWIYSRLAKPAPAPGEELPDGWHHFGLHCDDHFFQQLTSERVVIKDDERRFVHIGPARNEVLDCRRYALGAFRYKPRRDADFDAIEASLKPQPEPSAPAAPAPSRHAGLVSRPDAW